MSAPPPELLIVDPGIENRSLKLATRMADLGVFFPFAEGYRLPDRLPDALSGFRCIVIDAEQAAAEGTRLDAFEQAGGAVRRPSETEWQQESYIERVPAVGGLTLNHPAMIDQLHGVPDEEVFRATLRLSEIYLRPEWHDVLRYNIECLVEAYDLTGEQAILDHATQLVDLALANRPVPLESCDHIACLYAILHYADRAGRSDLVATCQDAADQFLGLAPRYRGVVNNFVRPDEHGILRAEIAFQFCPGLARLGRYTGDPKYAEIAVEQIMLQDRELREEETGLWRLGRGPSGLTPVLWARGCAFSLRGVVDTLAELDESHPRYQELLELLRRKASALRAFQDERGEWHQIVDEPDSRPESSSTAWTTAAFAKSLRLGWLDEEYRDSIETGWRGVKRRTWAGYSTRVCGGVTSSMDPDYYRHRHFLGPSYGHFNLSAAIEMLPLRNG